MKAMQKSLELMMRGHTESNASLKPSYQSKQSPELEELPAPEELGTLELFYQFFKEDGDEMAGNPSSVFAAFNREQGKLMVFAENSSDVEVFSHRSRGVLVALDWVQENNASFSVDGTQVLCEMGKVSAKGASYGEAALRALLKYQRLQRDAA